MPNPVFPAIGSINWYSWAQSIHDALIATRQRPPVVGVPLYARGTSYSSGAGATAGNDFVSKTAAALGATATYNSGSGGTNTPALVYQYADEPTKKWIPGTSTGLVMLEVGIGEALNEEDTTWQGHRRVFENQVLTALRWHRASALRKPSATTTITVDGTGATTESISNVGAVYVNPGVVMSGDGAGLTIALNETRDDLDVVLLFVAWHVDADAVNNGDYRIRVGTGGWRSGSTVGRGDPQPSGSSVPLTLYSERITGLAKNASIRVEKVGAGGQVLFYGYLLMNNQNPPPIILVQNTPLVESAGQWVIPAGNGFTSGPRKNTATLHVYRQIVEEIVNYPEFADGSVTTADPLPGWDPSIHLAADGLHPNDAGHAIYAAALQSAALRVGSS